MMDHESVMIIAKKTLSRADELLEYLNQQGVVERVNKDPEIKKFLKECRKEKGREKYRKRILNHSL